MPRAGDGIRDRSRQTAGLRARRSSLPRPLRGGHRLRVRAPRQSARHGRRRLPRRGVRCAPPAEGVQPRPHRVLPEAGASVITEAGEPDMIRPFAGPPLVTVEHLSKRYRNIVALDDVTLTLTDGITGLLGE